MSHTATADRENTSSSESESEAEEELLSSLCPYCNTRPPIYTCPRCFARSCSVACVRKHKLRRQCNGIRDPTAFVKRSKLMTEAGVNRDYAFLTGLEREISRPVDPAAMAAEGEEVEEAAEGPPQKKLLDRKQVKEAVRKLLAPRNIIVKWAPWEGFARAKENQTRVARTKRKAACVEWTVEWTLLDEDGKRILDHGVYENSEVAFAFFNPKTPDESRKAGKKVRGETEFYLVLEAPANQKRCVKMEPHKSWSDNLRERTILEFPQVLVTASKIGEVLKGWEVVPDDRKIVELPNDGEGSNKVARKPETRLEASKGEGQPAEGIEISESRPTTAGPETTESAAVDTSLKDLGEASKRKRLDDDISTTLAAIKKARQT